LGEKVAEAMMRVTDDEIAEYIEGVGSNQAFFMVSEVLNEPELRIKGLETFIERIENHYCYF
jgi:hypothetical protein